MNTAFRGGLGPKPERTACHQNKSTRRRAELYSFPGVTLGSVAAIAADVEPLKSPVSYTHLTLPTILLV